MSGIIEWGALGQVVLVGLLVGAGVPALFALGLRLLTLPVGAGVVEAGGTHDGEAAGAQDGAAPGLARRLGGYLCLALCVGAIATGLAFLVSGGH
ncbi:hypothetical protein [Promicromonospora sp. NPDC060271]|uniref:hypothetical protein n=1 Tax=Promicromonospora sp. NPDC060271 TaxID=3347089 RepID=UPI00364ABBDC